MALVCFYFAKIIGIPLTLLLFLFYKQAPVHFATASLDQGTPSTFFDGKTVGLDGGP
jgi:hypothetical protein